MKEREVNSMKKINYLKLLFGFIVPISAIVFTLTGCERNNTRKKINAFLEESKVEQFNKKTNGWEQAKISKGSKVCINNQLYMILKGDESGRHRLYGNLSEEIFSVEDDVWARNQPVYSRRDEYRYRCDLRLSQFADLIVETECYEAVKNLISYLNSTPYPDPDHWKLVLWVVIKIELALEKNAEAVNILNQFYSNNYSILTQIIDIDHNFLKFYINSQNQDIVNIFYPEKVLKIHRDGTLEYAIKTSSKEFQSALFSNYDISDSDIRKNFPLQQLKSSIENIKSSNPHKGGYVFVFDDRKHTLYSNITVESHLVDAGPTHSQHFTRYKTEIMHPVTDPDNAQILIYESYSYQKQVGWPSLYLCHTNVQAIDLTTQKTIFNKTFRTPPYKGSIIGSSGSNYAIWGEYKPELFAKQISEIVKRTL